MSSVPTCAAGDADCAHDAMVARLVAIWSETLAAPGISPASNFFDLGGDSLLALALFVAIERETGVFFPITTIYDAPTIAEMAALLLSDSRRPFSPLVLLKPGGAGNPLFLVHGIGGTVVELSGLARQIAIAEPVYALQARGIDGSEEPLRSVDAMAELYLDCIRGVQPDGPYTICGYSFGGLVALEMARRLQRLRQEISLLMLTDSFAHPATWPFPSRARVHLRTARSRLVESARHPRTRGLPIFRAWVTRILRQRFRSIENSQSRLREWLLDNNPDLPMPLLAVRQAGSAALSTYRPRFYPGKVTFIKPALRDPKLPLDPVPVWRPLVGEMDVRVVPGGHNTILTDHVAAVGNVIAACLAEAQEHATAGGTIVARTGERRRHPRLGRAAVRT